MKLFSLVFWNKKTDNCRLCKADLYNGAPCTRICRLLRRGI